VETVYLDTHVVVWLFAKELGKFSQEVLKLLEECELRVSAMVVLELEFLYEIGRLNYKAESIISNLGKTIGLKVCSLSFNDVIEESLKHSWTRDPFDRVIVANASYNGCVLISKDRNILTNYKRAIF